MLAIGRAPCAHRSCHRRCSRCDGRARVLLAALQGAFQSGGESLDPPAFRERPFNGRLWRASDPYVPGGRYDLRGTMLDDLVHRVRTGVTLADATSLLGPPDERRGETVYWLTGGYHRLDESCLALTVNSARRIDRVAIIDMTNEPALPKGEVDQWCPH